MLSAVVVVLGMEGGGGGVTGQGALAMVCEFLSFTFDQTVAFFESKVIHGVFYYDL